MLASVLSLKTDGKMSKAPMLDRKRLLNHEQHVHQPEAAVNTVETPKP